MIRSLRLLFGLIFVGMIVVTIACSLRSNPFDALPGLLRQPWAVATLFDAYFGFATFYAWLFYREGNAAARIGWLIAIVALGNIAMSLYVLLILFRLPSDATAADLLLRPAPGSAS